MKYGYCWILGCVCNLARTNFQKAKTFRQNAEKGLLLLLLEKLLDFFEKRPNLGMLYHFILSSRASKWKFLVVPLFYQQNGNFFATADFVTLAKQVTDVLELVLNKYTKILKLLLDESAHHNPLFFGNCNKKTKNQCLIDLFNNHENQSIISTTSSRAQTKKVMIQKNHDLKGTKHQSIAWQSVVGSLVHAK